MSKLVIDASVAAKWFLPSKNEPLAQEALGILENFASGEIQLIVPDLFWAEMGNILWKAVRVARCTKKTAELALTSLQQQKLSTVSCANLLTVAFEIATGFDRSLYDSLYVALAVQSKSQLVTADERLANSLAAHLPVKWLGAL